MYRKIQNDTYLEYDRQVKEESFEDVVLRAVTGGGKTACAWIAFSMLANAGKVLKVCYLTPRENLKTQTAESALEGIEINGKRIRLEVNEASNEIDPSRGLDGYVTTYQALTSDRSRINALEFERHPYLLVLDECHHVAVGGSTERALRPLVESAAARLFMSGTLERGDNKPIAFLPYTKITGEK
ncbi:DEAD/DEAH box helicase family protein [Gammaproteobacteria bacterium]|nr:DEAD/DEAH box helicase family protein [Gammaproteobacteria bacterium]